MASMSLVIAHECTARRRVVGSHDGRAADETLTRRGMARLAGAR
jgi:hypothetical protein